MLGNEKRGKAGQEQQLQKICRDTKKVANEQIKGISAQVNACAPFNASKPPTST